MHNRKFTINWTFLLLTTFVCIFIKESKCASQNSETASSTSSSSSSSGTSTGGGGNTKKSDEYVFQVQSECYQSKRILSCFKYRAARYIWSFATGRMNLFEYDNASKEFATGFKIVQLSEPDNFDLFSDARQIPNDNEIGKAIKFLKRSLSTFIDGHGVRIGIGADRGPRFLDTSAAASENNITDNDEARGKLRKKKKWNLIFPLAIIIKLLHIKLTLVPILLGIGLLQLVLIVGGALLFHYLRNNTLCRFQPHLVHSHSHITSEGGPEIGTGGYASSYGSYPYGGPSYIPGAHAGGYNKDWASNRAYSAYSFLDTVAKH